MWRTTKQLLHSNPPNTLNDVECKNMSSAFCQFFVGKIEHIRQDIRSASRLIHNVDSLVGRQYTGQLLSSFSDVTPVEVLKLINNMPNKSSPRDAMPTSLLKSCADVFSPVIARLANMSFTSGEFPSIYKTAQVLPLLKKPVLIDQFLRTIDQSQIY